MEDEDADGASDEIEIECYKIDNYGDEFVDTCGFSVRTDKAKFTVDHSFTLFAEYSDVVGWCFMVSEEWHLWDSRVFLSDWRTVGSK